MGEKRGKGGREEGRKGGREGSRGHRRHAAATALPPRLQGAAPGCRRVSRSAGRAGAGGGAAAGRAGGAAREVVAETQTRTHRWTEDWGAPDDDAEARAGSGPSLIIPPALSGVARRTASFCSPFWEALVGGGALWFFRGGRGEGPPWGRSALRQPLPAPPRPALPHQGNFRWGVAKTERERETEEEGHPARGPAGGPSMALSLSGSQMIDPNALARREAEVARREVRLRPLPPPPPRGARSAPLRPAGRHMHPSPRVPRPPPCLRGGTWRLRAPYGASCPADSSRRLPTPTPLARPLPTNSDPLPPTSAARRSTRRRGRGRGGAARGLTEGGPARRNNAISARSSWTSSTRRSSHCPRSWRP